MERTDDGHYRLRLSRQQQAMVYECLVFARDSDEEEAIVYTGSGRQPLATLAARLSPQSGETAWTLTPGELHTVYATLIFAVTELYTEEDFHTRIGWYKENAVALARDITRQLRGGGIA
ncbi:hypothetical protein SRB5_63330 [Streptomyces sp. RB5]|uniref:Uncharacterized protein n=1 Tax=Streptomyces smaragdinus TaxID=2585196 RepID=A0A7K0CRT9_9ACTN|nr:hypothetical protein [Streptomyces smaragdinus]MQY16140.1 hypothetical protein [Streptomyces smaragdinus]